MEIVHGVFEDAIEFISKVPAVQPRDGISDGLRGKAGDEYVGWVVARFRKELVVYFAWIGDVGLGFSTADYAAPDDGRVDFEGVH